MMAEWIGRGSLLVVIIEGATCFTDIIGAKNVVFSFMIFYLLNIADKQKNF
jgi:hypothetical protein